MDNGKTLTVSLDDLEKEPKPLTVDLDQLDKPAAQASPTDLANQELAKSGLSVSAPKEPEPEMKEVNQFNLFHDAGLPQDKKTEAPSDHADYAGLAQAGGGTSPEMRPEDTPTVEDARAVVNAPVSKAVRDTAAAGIKGVTLGVIDPHKGTINYPLTQTDTRIKPSDPRTLTGQIPGLGGLMESLGVSDLPTSFHMYPETAAEDRSATLPIDLTKAKQFGDAAIAAAVNTQMPGGPIMPPNPDILPGKTDTLSLAEGAGEMIAMGPWWESISKVVDAMGVKLLDRFGVKGLQTVSGMAAAHHLLPEVAGATADATVKTSVQILENAVQRMARNDAIRRIAGQTATGSIFEALRPRMGPPQAPDLNIPQYEQNLMESSSKLGELHDAIQKSRDALDTARVGVNNKDPKSVDMFNQMVLQHNAMMADYQMQAQHWNAAKQALINVKQNPDLISTHPVGEGESLGGRMVGGASVGALGGLTAESLGLIAKAHADSQFGSALGELHKEVSDRLLSKQEYTGADGVKQVINSRAKADAMAADLINKHLSPDATTKEVKTAAKVMRDVKTKLEKAKSAPAAEPKATTKTTPEEPPASSAAPEVLPPAPKTPQSGGSAPEPESVTADLEELKKPTIEGTPVEPAKNPVTRGEAVLLDHEGEQKQGTVTFAAKAGKGTWVKVKLDDGQTVKVEQSELSRPTAEVPLHPTVDEERIVAEKPVPENSGGGNNYTAEELKAFKAKHNIPEVKSEKVGEEKPIELSTEHKAGDRVNIASVDGGKTQTGTVVVATKNGAKIKVDNNGGTRIYPAHLLSKSEEVESTAEGKEDQVKKTPYAQYKGNFAKPPVNIGNAGDYITDGSLMIEKASISKEHVGILSKLEEGREEGRVTNVQPKAAKSVWDKFTQADSVPVTLGQVHHFPGKAKGGKKQTIDAVELLNKNGKPVSTIDARYAKHIQEVTGANHVETTGRNRPAVFYKDSKPVAIVAALDEPRITGEVKPNKPAKEKEERNKFKQNAEIGTHQAHPSRYPAAEDVPTREYRDEYTVDKLPHPYERKLPKEAKKREAKLKEALAGLKKKRPADMAAYAKQLEKAKADPHGSGDDGYDTIASLVLTYNHLTHTNSYIAAIEKELGLPVSVKESPAKERPKYQAPPPGKTEFTEEDFKRAKEIIAEKLEVKERISPHDLFRDTDNPIDTDYNGALHLMRQMVERGDLKLDQIIPAYARMLEEGGSHAVQKPGAEGVLQREPSEAGEAGSKRGRVEPVQQGKETATAHEEASSEPSNRPSDEQVPAAPVAKGAEVAATTEDGKEISGKVVDITANQHGGKVDILTKDGEIETVSKDDIQAPEAAKKESYGGGPFTIYKMPGLTDRQRAVEKKVATWAQRHNKQAIFKLIDLPESRNGHYISGDLAREIFPEYNNSPEARTEFDLAVANTAAAVAKAAFEHELKSSGTATRAILLAGNPGAGKTTAFEGDTLVHPNESNYLVYEASIASEGVSAERIRFVIESGHKPVQVYIHADPMVAFRSILERAKDDYGRTVPIDTQVNLITTMPKVLEHLYKEFGDKITFKVYDNSARVSPVPEITVDHLLRIAYNGDANELRQQLQDELDRLHEAGEVPDGIYEAVRSRKLRAGQEDSEQLQKGSDEEKGIASLIDAVYTKLKSGEALGNVTELNKLAEAKLGSSRVSGKWTPKDMFDAMEAGINKYLLERGKELMDKSVPDGLAELRGLLDRVTSQGVRTDEQLKNQQFSTPPTIAYVVAKVADIQPTDTVLEPSAGNGGLAIWAKAIGAEVHVNEIAPRRQAMLEAVGFDKPSGHDGEILNALLDPKIKPTVVVMNPPFSASTQKSYEAKNRNQYGFNHVDAALQRLQNGGRLVAILGGGRADDTNGGATLTTGPSGKWFERIAQTFNVRANVRIHGREYQKYGTAFATRIIVIDKDGPTPSRVATGEVKTWDSVKQGNFDTLEEAYANVLATIAESRPERAAVATAGQSATGVAADTDISPASGRTRVRGSRGAGKEVEPASGSGRPVGEPGGDRADSGDQRVPLHQPDVPARPNPETAPVEGAGGGDQDGRSERPIPSAAAESGIDLERVAEATDLKEQEDTSAFVAYRPSIKGATHPGAIVETKTMATVPLPTLNYKPSLPQESIDKGLISAVQLEAIAIAGMQNDIVLPSGHRATALIGDGTGVGKGREGSGILLDNWNKGRRRQVWVSEKWDLMPDAQRDLKGVGAEHLAKSMKALGKMAVTTPIDHEGIVFTTYALIRSEDKKGNKRITQLEQWLRGQDDANGAYILFDESHNLKNAVAAQGGQVSQVGAGVKAFMERMPNLRSTSLSATAASEVINLGYLDRLGLWGPGTAFPNGFAQFAAEIGTGGMSAMEMIARELKSQGKYISRTLSYRGVTYKELQHEITPEQKEVYRSAVKAWKVVSAKIEHVIMNVTNGGGFQKSRAMSAFYSSQQRFFNVLLTTLKIPTAIEDAQAALDEGKSVVISLVNTNEAAQNREKNKYAAREDDDEIPDYDFGPGEMLVDMVREHFPVQQFMDDVDSSGKPIKTPVYVTDAEGRQIPLTNPEAIRERDELLAQLKRDLHMPANPLDILIEALGGHTKVAEITGRKERYDESTGTFVSRGGEGVKKADINKNEENKFNTGKKRVAILSSAGGTGISLHAGHDMKNQQRRHHVTLQVGWSADKAMQMLGRTNRSNQVHPPEYTLLKSNLGGESRFISTIARRLGSLEALSKGQTKTNEGTDTMSKVNFETEQGRAATNAFYENMLRDVVIPGTEVGDQPALNGMQVLTDLAVLKADPKSGRMTVPPADRTNVTRLLNRLLALDPDVQNAVYEYFYSIFQATIKQAIQQGTLDTGVRTMPGDEFDVKDQRMIATDPKTGAGTFYYPVNAHVRTNRVSPKDLAKVIRERAPQDPSLIWRPKTGKVMLTLKARPIVHANGTTTEAVYLITPSNGNWTKVPKSQIYDAVPVEEQAKSLRDTAQKEFESAKWQHDYSTKEFERNPGDDWAKGRKLQREEAMNQAQKRLDEAIEATKDPMEWAKEEWRKEFDSSPSHLTIEHHLIGGAVLHWWNPIKESFGERLRIYTTTDSKTGKRVVGIDIPSEKINSLLSRISGNQSTVNGYQIVADVLNNNMTYRLDGGITISRGRVAGYNVVLLKPRSEEVGNDLKRLGVIYERGAVPKYYLPTSYGEDFEGKAKEIMDRVLQRYPAQAPESLNESVAPFGWDKVETTPGVPAADYEAPRGSVPPVITVNPAAIALMRRAVPGVRPFHGLSMGRAMARRWAEKLQDASEIVTEFDSKEAKTLERLSDMFVAAADAATHSGVVVSLEGNSKAMAEEVFHSGQRYLGMGATEAHLPQEAIEKLMAHPVGKKAIDWLEKNGYEGKEDALLVAETAAKIAVFDSAIYEALTPEEAADWFTEYLDAIAKAHSIDSLQQFADRVIDASMGMFERARYRVVQRRKAAYDEEDAGRGSPEGEGGSGEAGQDLQLQPPTPAQESTGADDQAGTPEESAITDSPAFKQWFGDSKVVDAAGKPLVVYHATNSAFDSFKIGYDPKVTQRLAELKEEGERLIESNLPETEMYKRIADLVDEQSRIAGPSDGIDDIGTWFTPSKSFVNYVAEFYRNRRSGGAQVMPTYLSVKNPLVISNRDNMTREVAQQAMDVYDAMTPLQRDMALGEFNQSMNRQREKEPGKFTEQVRNALIARGYDGLHVLDDFGHGEAWVPFHPTQIKSAIANNGAFDPTKESISESRVPHPEKAAAIEKYQAGESSDKIAEDLSIGATTVLRWVKDAGIIRTAQETAGRALSDETKQKAVELYDSGMSVGEVALQLKIGTSTIHRLVVAAGKNRKLSDVRDIPANIKEQALSLYKDNKNTYEVADQLGIGQNTVARWMRDAGISRGYSGAQALRSSLGRGTTHGISIDVSSAKSGAPIHVDSVYELARVKQLSTDDQVASVSRATDRVPYGDQDQTYSPDLLVTYKNGTKVVEEIKPEYKLDDPVVIEKAKAAEAYFAAKDIRYRIVTERTIGLDGFDKVEAKRVTESIEQQKRIRASLATVRWYLRKSLSNEATHETGDEGQPMFNLPAGGSGGGGAGAKPAKFKFANEETEKEFEAARGIQKPSGLDKARETLDRFVRMSTRTYEHLPRGAMYEPLRFELKKLEKGRAMAADEAARNLHKITGALDHTQFYNFSVKVILDDLLETAKDGLDIPFYGSLEELEQDHAAITAHIASDQAIQQSLAARKTFWDGIKANYVRAMEDIGFKVAKRFARESYYRHQVIQFANAKGNLNSQSGKLKTPTGRGFLKERKGSQLPINTDYIQAEHEVMANFTFDVQVAKTIKFVENNYNMVNALKKQAMATNHEGIMEHFRAITEATPDVSPEQMYRRTLNTKQAMALSQLKELAADGDLPNGYGANDFSDIIDDLAKAHLKTAVAGAPQQQMPEASIKRMMQYLGWLVKQDHIPAKIAAGTFFKGVADKKAYIKRTLGRDFVTWRDLVPDTHRIWQPREGSTLYFTKTVPEQVAEELMSGAAKSIGITKDQLRNVMARGDRFREYVVPNEVGDTIDNLRPSGAPTMLGSIAKPLVKWWKFYELSSPRRFLRFRMRHISGQAEAMFVGNHSAFKFVPEAAKEVYDYARHANPSPEFKQWLQRGGTGSSLLSAEIGELDKLHLFKRLYEAEKSGKAQKLTETVLQGYWKASRLSVDLAESVLRYAAYKDYLGQMRGNSNRYPNNWGASRPDEVLALTDLRDRAYKMANDLLGAYDDISALGREIRSSAMPFWSFQEINLKRAYRFFANNGYEAGPNAGGGGKGTPPPNSGKGHDYTSDGWNAWRAGRRAAGTAAKKAPFLAYKIGRTLGKMSGFWALLTTINLLLHPKEYEELTDEQKAKPTLILGRDKDGQVIHTTHLGAMAELLGWFGADTPQRIIRDWMEGKKTTAEVAIEMVKQPANRLIGGVSPLLKIPVELMTGKSYFPDAFKPQQIRSRMDYIAKQFNLENELHSLQGKPSRGYLNSWWNAAFDRIDRGSTAYYEIQDAKKAFLAKVGKEDDSSYTVTPKSEALHNAKLALHFGDQKAYEKYMTEYLMAGGSFKTMNHAFSNMNPLAGLSKEERIGFMATLSQRDQEKLSEAMRYYLLYLSPGEHTDDTTEEDQQ